MKSIEFFEHQFRQQVENKEFTLNSFEQAVLPHLSGSVLDLGCGLGNLAIAAARQGCIVTALDASRVAVDRINEAANRLGLKLAAYQIDLSRFEIEGDYECIVSIGLLMFFPQDTAHRMLAGLLAQTRPGGIAAVNVLTEGTSFTGMFEPGHFYLFGKDELTEAFEGWEVLLSECSEFPAPENTVKKFHTVIARKPT